uniref:Solute carrier family 2 member 13 n=1 Tax=Anas platyrhynchos platyrhynchos TaxID=8840 RepID=A0A493T260_ANAPP
GRRWAAPWRLSVRGRGPGRLRGAARGGPWLPPGRAGRCPRPPPPPAPPGRWERRRRRQLPLKCGYATRLSAGPGGAGRASTATTGSSPSSHRRSSPAAARPPPPSPLPCPRAGRDPRRPSHVPQGQRQCGVHAAEPEQPDGREAAAAAGGGGRRLGGGGGCCGRAEPDRRRVVLQPQQRGVGRRAGAGGSAAVPAGRDPRLRLRGVGFLRPGGLPFRLRHRRGVGGPAAPQAGAQPGRPVAGAAGLQHGGRRRSLRPGRRRPQRAVRPPALHPAGQRPLHGGGRRAGSRPRQGDPAGGTSGGGTGHRSLITGLLRSVVAISAQEWGICLRGKGVASMTVPVYIAEVAPPHLRGRLVTINTLFITGGQFFASVVDGLFSYLAKDGWRYMLGLSAVPAVIQFFGFLFLPESPRWLIQKGQTQRARRILSQMRGNQAIDEEYDSIKNNIEEEEKEVGAAGPVICRMLTYPPTRRALIVGCGLQMFQQLSGINTVMLPVPSRLSV